MVKAVPAPPRRFLLSDSARLLPKKPLNYNTHYVQLCEPQSSTVTGLNDTHLVSEAAAECLHDVC